MSELLLDGLSAIERIKVTGQLAAQVGVLGDASSPLARIQAGRQVAELIRKLTEAAEDSGRPARTKLTTQRLHSVIQASTGVLSSQYSPTQRIDRITYDIHTRIKGVYGVLSAKHIEQIAEALRAAGIQFDDSEISKGFVKIPVWQESSVAVAETEDKPRIRNFGWDAVKLSDLSMEELEELRRQVEAEHANPLDEKGHPLENGQPTINLYDKKGRWKLDKLAWAVTYKLQEAKAAAAEPVPADGKSRAVAGGQEGINGYTYKGGQFLPNTMAEPGRWKLDGKWVTAGKEQVAPGEWEFAPTPFSRSIYMASGLSVYGEDAGGGALRLRQGLRDSTGEPVTLDSEVRPGVRGVLSKTAFTMREMLNAYNQGLRWVEVEPDAETITTQDAEELAKAIAKFKAIAARNATAESEVPAEPGAQGLEIVEHVTGRGKTLRGVIRTDLSYAQAKEIDPYTFKKDGGFFIREKHLEGYTPGDAASVVKPELTPEQQAQAEADRLANEQLRVEKKRVEQAAKLRQAAQSTIDKAEEELGRDRLTNTARRADMAAGVIARNEQARALGKTMLNLAEAIESGRAEHLAGITSRAAVETLHNALVSAMSDRDNNRGWDYREKERNKGRPAEAADAEYARYPAARWDSAGANRLRILEALKGKRGVKELAERVRYASEASPDDVDQLVKLLGEKEASYQLGWWNIEQVKRVRRLQRAGIHNINDLRAALVEYLQFREGVREEDPIKKAERAIIGQKVGIDFFPTPTGEAQRMVQLANIQQGERVLEPSAGNGNIADAAAAAGAKVDVIEISSQLRDILKAKGYNIVDHDFETFEPEQKYDAILMNPPFSDRKDAAHIMRAFDMLKPGGRLVAIAGEGVFFGTDKKAVAFREWLEQHAAEVEQLPQGTFTDKKLLATTGANARMLVMQKA